MKPAKKVSKSWYRYTIQIFFFILVAFVSATEALSQSGLSIPVISSASLHAICPFGGVVSIYNFLTAGTFVQKIHESSFILMLAAFLLSIAFGPVICGWVCPFGTFQEWLGKLGRKIFGTKFNHFIPQKLDNYLRFLRYLVLLLVVYVTASSAKLVFQNADPYYALFNFWTGEVKITALIVLSAVIIMSLFVERPWCKYACPYGALLGLFNFIRIFKIRREPQACISCNKCSRACPMNIPVASSTVITNHQCISCLKCTSENSCPVKSTVNLSSKGVK